MSAARSATARRPHTLRSAVSNGTRLLEGIDYQCPAARRFRDLIEDLTADLGGDLSAAEQQQVRLVAGLLVHSEQLMADVVNGKAVDSEQVTRVANVAARLLATLKAKHQARKPPAPTLAEYLADKAKREAEAACPA
jgi:hypothetical protein